MRSILIIDGDQDSKTNLRESLRKEAYKVYYSDRAKTGLDKAREKIPDLIIMELDFQDADGFALIQDLKFDQKLSHIPVMILSQRSTEFDKVLALEMGADDYIIKPVSFREVSARIKAQFRYARLRPKEENDEEVVIRYADMIIRPHTGEVFVNGETVIFSSKEFSILCMMVKSKGKIVKRESIIYTIAGSDTIIEPALLNAYISNIKRKISKKSRYNFNIQIVGKSGYKLEIKEKNNEVV